MSRSRGHKHGMDGRPCSELRALATLRPCSESVLRDGAAFRVGVRTFPAQNWAKLDETPAGFEPATFCYFNFRAKFGHGGIRARGLLLVSGLSSQQLCKAGALATALRAHSSDSFFELL